MVFGYVRVSTKDQNRHLQIDALKKFGAEKIFEESVSGLSAKKIEFDKLYSLLRNGDTVAVWRIDRLGRRTLELVKLMAEFAEMGVNFVSLTEGIDTRTPIGKVYFLISAVLAENEVAIIRERTNTGLESARERGRVGGKPKGLSDEAKRKASKAYILRLKGLTNVELLKTCDIKSKRTLYKYIKFEAERLSKLTGKKINDNGIDLIDFNEK